MNKSTTPDEGGSEMGPFSIIPEWVIDEDISNGAVRLYCVLATYTNKKRVAWPSRGTLAKRLNLSVQSVDRFMKELQKINAVSVEHRIDTTKTGTKVNRSNLYTLRVIKPRVASPMRPPSPNDEARGSLTLEAQNYTHLELEPKNYKTSECFEVFWIEYDKKVGKKKARDQWNRNVKDEATAELVIRAAKSQRVSTEAKYRKDPERWLRDHRWLDEPVSAITTKSSIDRFKNYADTRGLTDG